MPWTPADAERHIKGLTDKQSRAWAKVANSARARCIKDGGSEKECDGRAIKQANAAAKRIKEADVGKEEKQYNAVGDLPASVAEKYSKEALAVFLKVLNDTLAKADDEDAAFKAAHTAARKKDGLGAAPGGMGLGLQKTGSRKVEEAIEERLAGALGKKLEVEVKIVEVADDFLIYESSGKTYRLPYEAGSEGKVTTGESEEVKTVYEPVASESESLLAGDVIPLDEKAVTADGNLDIRIVKPGWGSSGYYGKDMLTRDAAIYKPGMKMYWDHPTESEDRERPERSLRDLAAELTTPGQFKNGALGPGVYANAQVFGPYKEAVKELASHIGLSHRVLGRTVRGEAEGKKGPIVEKMVAARSVDFVTTPGAGGEIVQLFEAARDKASHDMSIDWQTITIEALEQHRPDLTEGIKESEEAKRMSEDELKELTEAKEGLEVEKGELTKENDRLKESAILREARDMAAEKVSESDLPDITKARLVESLAKVPVLKEGKLDKDEYVKAIEEAVKGEADYIAQITGAGKIKGMGSSDEGSTADKDKLKESFKAGFMREGKTIEEADRMAQIAVDGR